MLAEAAINGIAEAVFGTAYELFHVEERLLRWLGREPAKLAFEKALLHAYSAFARNYPDLTASLFDASFLSKEAAPELAKLITRHKTPDPGELARLWSISLGTRDPSPLTRPAADFLNWLELELKSEPAFQPVFDSRALEKIPSLEEKVDEMIQELRGSLASALVSASQYENIIARTGDVESGAQVAIGSNIRQNVTNIFNQYFSGRFTSLYDFYINPDAIFQRVRIDEFVGREWLAARVDEFLNDPKRKSGAFVLVGEAGVGKTAFLAHLVRERRYLHLFAEQVPGDANLKRALQSLGAQIVTRYQLEDYTRRDTLPAIAEFPDFLERLLRLAAGRLAGGEKIVITCDAMDEAGTGSNGNVFGLPAILPEGVYLILSRRPLHVRLHFKEFIPHEEALDPASTENRQDVEAYLAAIARRLEIAEQLRAHGYGDADFIRTLADKSGGVWMYLYYVVREVAEGVRAPLDLTKLPSSLAEYYDEYWGRWREDVEKWDLLYAPLLGTLAAAQDALTVERLLLWAGVGDRLYAVRRLLDDRWKAFLKRTDDNRYELYHASLRDFLTGDVSRLGRTSDLTDEMHERTRNAHVRIVEYYRAQCGGDWSKLIDDDYARRHLVIHLAGACQHAELFELVAKSNSWAEARYRKEENYAGFLSDLDLVWSWAKSDKDWNIGYQIRCGLIRTSIHSQAENMPPELLFQLVNNRFWSFARALAFIPQIPDEEQRADAIIRISPLLSERLKDEAIGMALEISNKKECVRALTGLAVYLTDNERSNVLQKALRIARTIDDDEERAVALSELVMHLPDQLREEILKETYQLTLSRKLGQGFLAETLGRLAPLLSNTVKGQALNTLKSLPGKLYCARAIKLMARYLPEELRAEAMNIVRNMDGVWDRAIGLVGLAVYLPEGQKIQALAEALQQVKLIPSSYGKREVIAGLASFLPNDLRVLALRNAVEIEDEKDRAIALGELAPYLANELKLEALTVARATIDQYARADALSRLVGYLPGEIKDGVVQEALKASRNIADQKECITAISELVNHMSNDLKNEAIEYSLELIQSVSSSEESFDALVNIASCLEGDLKNQVLRDAAQKVWTIKDIDARTDKLAELCNHLPDESRSEILQVAQTLTDEEERTVTMARLAAYVSGELIPQIIHAISAISHEGRRALALINLVTTRAALSDDLKLKILQIAQNMTITRIRAITMAVLADYISPDIREAVITEAISVAQEIDDEQSRIMVLSLLGKYLQDDLKIKTLQATEKLHSWRDRDRALIILTKYLPSESKILALQTTQKLPFDIERAEVLAKIIPYLPEELRNEALQESLVTAQAIEEDLRAKPLAYLTTYLPNELRARILPEVFTAMKTYKWEFEKKFLLTLIVSNWQGIEFRGLDKCRDIISELMQSQSRHSRQEFLRVLSAIVPIIFHLGGPGAIREVYYAIRDVSFWWP